MTICPNCKNSGFELYQEVVSNSNYPITFIRCISCKSAISVLPPTDASTLIKLLALKLGHTI